MSSRRSEISSPKSVCESPRRSIFHFGFCTVERLDAPIRNEEILPSSCTITSQCNKKEILIHYVHRRCVRRENLLQRVQWIRRRKLRQFVATEPFEGLLVPSRSLIACEKLFHFIRTHWSSLITPPHSSAINSRRFFHKYCIVSTTESLHRKLHYFHSHTQRSPSKSSFETQ